MNKLARIINELEYEEVKLIKKDIDTGNMENLINARLKKFEEEKAAAICPICSTPINNPENGALTLFFGPKNFRKKATFEAIDCMEYFTQHLKKISEKKIREDNE